MRINYSMLPIRANINCRLLLCCLAVTCLSGCFKMGLVENYAPLISAHQLEGRGRPSTEEPSGERSRILVLRPTHSAAKHQSLGHQYVLGFIPATRLYLEQGAEDFVFETVLEQLQLEGNSDEHGEDQPGGDQMDGGLHGGPRLPLEADA